MKDKKVSRVHLLLVVLVWLALTLWAWCKPAQDISQAERRKLQQFPTASADTLLSGKFMTDFESYSLDQFPARDGFRRLKALFHYYVLQQGDNNGIYMQDGAAATLEDTVSDASLNHAADHFNALYESYLRDGAGNIYFSIVPDKNYYLAEGSGVPTMDYEALFAKMQEATSWATYIDITDCLTAADYYRTDTHWRQERLGTVAEKIGNAMGVTVAGEDSYTHTKLERPFYGVYYGQAALPMDPDEMWILESPTLDGCKVYNHETGKTTTVYDMEKLESSDLYDVYLSGGAALLTVENPEAKQEKELIVFRDSYASSLIPLLLDQYSTVTVVDTRYIASDLLEEYVSFHGQDVLMLYSTSILNNSYTLK